MQEQFPQPYEEIAQKNKGLDLPKYSDPDLFCASHNKITLICINRFCNAPSLHCQNQKCTFCKAHQEMSCNSIQLHSLTILMNTKSQQLKYFLDQMIKLEIGILKVLQKNKYKMLQRAKQLNLTKEEMSIVQSIFGKSNNWNNVTGLQADTIISKLKNKNQAFRVEEQLRILKDKISAITDQILGFQKTCLLSIVYRHKQYAKVESKIMEHDPVGLSFILHELNYPFKLKLLFRASQHGFSAQEFHKKCDYIPNNLTIIRTVHNKVIAGYTPLTWEEPDQKLEQFKYKQDEGEQTFLLSVTHRQRYQQTQYHIQAIHCSNKQGPSFGYQDFVVTNGDPQNGAYIYMDFPTNFNYRKCYITRPQTIQKILGEGKGKYVPVFEYEVYQVIKRCSGQNKMQEEA